MPKAIDLTSKRFGMLTVTKKTDGRAASGAIVWECECECGKICTASSNSLRSGHKTSCGCKQKHNLTGRRFGLLKVLERAQNKREKVAWRCRCDCGRETVTTTYYLLSGQTSSCGCLRVKHNGVKTRLYRIWRGIKNRCENPNLSNWKYYGGKGVRICTEWKSDFNIFREWANANGYSPDLQIDRINPKGNYCPENCRWVTPTVNSRNRKTIKLNKDKVLEIKRLIDKGDDLHVIAKRHNIHPSTLRDIICGRTWRDVK